MDALLLQAEPAVLKSIFKFSQPFLKVFLNLTLNSKYISHPVDAGKLDHNTNSCVRADPTRAQLPWRTLVGQRRTRLDNVAYGSANEEWRSNGGETDKRESLENA